MELCVSNSLDTDYLFVCGFAGSGKSSYAKILAGHYNANFVEVSDIVKNLIKKRMRSEIAVLPELRTEIVAALQALTTPLVISGARQLDIIKAFPDSPIIWIDVPQKLRGERINRRNEKEDDIDITTCDHHDSELGITEIRSYVGREK